MQINNTNNKKRKADDASTSGSNITPRELNDFF